MIETLAIIPARGGSVGVPRKNARPLAGKPLIVHTIEQALAAASVTRVVVSTDDEEIATISRAAGAEVVRRPADLSGSKATSESALLHVLDSLAQSESYRPEVLVFLQCTSPLTLAEDIDGTVNAMLDEGADSALAVTDFHYFLWGRDAGGRAVGINHDKRVRPMRQDREPQFLETGAVYAMRVEGFRKANHRFFGVTAMYETPAERCLEIDEPVDFEVAEMLMRAAQSDARLRLLPRRVGAVAFDFDGVFTDNRVWVSQDGAESVACNRSDGMGLSALRKAGVPMTVISTEVNPVVAARCEKLKLPCLQGIDDKPPVLLAWLAEQGVAPADAVFVGNDVNDLGCLTAVGCGVVVADAHPAVRAAGRIVLTRDGGRGAVRELCDLVLRTLQS